MNPIGGELLMGLTAAQRSRIGNGNAAEYNTLNMTVGSGRRKSLSYHPPQLSLKSNNLDSSGSGAVTVAGELVSSAGRFSPHPNELFLSQSAKLTIPPQDKFDETLINSCLHPPPSPAPNSDSHTSHIQPLNLNHFQSPSQSHVHSQVHSHTHSHAHSHLHPHSHSNSQLHSQIYPLSSSNSISSLSTSNNSSSVPSSQAGQKLHSVRSMSPNAKIRLERYREPGQKSPALSGGSAGRYYQLSSVGSNYLAATVHTPVKRYVPTPPASVDSYVEQYVNMPLPYNYRAKCCHLRNETESAMKSPQSSTIETSCPCTTETLIGISQETQLPRVCSPKLRLSADTDSMLDLQNSVEGGNSSIGGTCLHCNTARRTTGVHQTTQTTGPISPVPVAMHLPHTPLLVSAIKQQHQEREREQEQLMMTLSPASIAVESRHGSTNGNTISFSRQALYSAPQQALQIIPHQQHSHTHPHQQQQQQLQQHQQLQQQQQQPHRYSCKKRLGIYMRGELSRFFGVESSREEADFALWHGRHRRMAIRRFGSLNYNTDIEEYADTATERPDILPAQQQNSDISGGGLGAERDFHAGDFVERKATVAKMFMTSFIFIINMFNHRSKEFEQGLGHFVGKRRQRQWSRSFAPIQEHNTNLDLDAECNLASLIEDELFFDVPSEGVISGSSTSEEVGNKTNNQQGLSLDGVYIGERHHNGWRTSALIGSSDVNLVNNHEPGTSHQHQQQQAHLLANSVQGQFVAALRTSNSTTAINRGSRITAQLLDGVLENSRRPQLRQIKYFLIDDLDDRSDHRPFFTYWINTVHIVVLFLSLVCYGIAPIGLGVEQKTGQVLVTSLSLQTVQHVEPRNLWIGPRNNDLVHMGAKFSACMRRDIKIINVLTKTRRQERETACCIRNDDSGCVQSSQADCSIRGLYPTKSISTWKKWSPGESGPGGRISGSVCGLDPKFCDAPASIAPYEWPDDITKWPICRKTNSFSQRYRYKDHTAEHMVCEVIGHPCCTGLYGECRITTREYCDFVSGYFHEEASLCSQISCLNNVCGMFPFISLEIPDQIYRLLTSLCMHAGVLHLLITLIVQHLFLSDLERLMGTIRTAIVYIMSGMAGNLTSAVLVPHRPEVGPSASLCGVVASLVALLIWMHWKHLQKPYVALFKLMLLFSVLFGMGTLPYQLNFAGLLAGVACGAFLTISLVPFTSFSKYERKKKINLVWTCIIFHLFVYTMLFATFYIHPSEFSKLNFIDDLFGSENTNSFISVTNGNNALQNNSDIISSTTRKHGQTQKPQFYYHHHSEDIIRNDVPFKQDTSISYIYSEPQRQKWSSVWNKKYNFSTVDKNMRRIKDPFDLVPFSSALSQRFERLSNNKKNNYSQSYTVLNKSSANQNNI